MIYGDGVVLTTRHFIGGKMSQQLLDKLENDKDFSLCFAEKNIKNRGRNKYR